MVQIRQQQAQMQTQRMSRALPALAMENVMEGSDVGASDRFRKRVCCHISLSGRATSSTFNRP
jgi:hypothetical protein